MICLHPDNEIINHELGCLLSILIEIALQKATLQDK